MVAQIGENPLALEFRDKVKDFTLTISKKMSPEELIFETKDEFPFRFFSVKIECTPWKSEDPIKLGERRTFDCKINKVSWD